VFAGWLMALLAWLLASTTSSLAQIVLIWLCTAPISALHFRHSVVGSTEAFYRAALGDASWGGMLWGFVTPAVLGNAIGGVLLVALLNTGQVLADRSTEDV
jgi:formate/nitrite transporter FocA (FNT family)